MPSRPVFAQPRWFAAKLARVVLRASFLLAFSSSQSLAEEPPLVYDVENSGAEYPVPEFPPFEELPTGELLPDPFVFFDGSPRDTSFASWERRRNEIKASIEKYEIGPKPDTSDLEITAAYIPGLNGGVLEVHVLRTSNGQSLTLTSNVYLPSDPAPSEGFPALISVALAPSGGTNGLPPGIARIDYMHDNVTQYSAGVQVSHAADPYFRMYPEYHAGPCPDGSAPCGEQVGQYSAWAWGVSRLIDGIEIAAKQLVSPLPIDTKHLGISGCSYAGKMALFSGAFDERIAATFAIESGGGGAPAWRVSHAIEPDGTVEKTNNTDGSWFKSDMKSNFRGDAVYKLPHDHHELMAMVAPRALMISGNTDFTWLSNRSKYVTARAVKKIYETFGIGDRFGFWIDGGHGHCSVPADQQESVNAFWEKFLLGIDNGWEASVYPSTPAFTELDYALWTSEWGSQDEKDVTPPSISIVSPGDDATYRLNESIEANYSCFDSGSGVASCEGSVAPGNNIDTSTVGLHDFTVHATDLAGNASEKSVNYWVQYDFVFANLVSPPAQNTAKAGSTIVIRFKLRDATGQPTSDLNSLVALNSFTTDCLSLVPTSEAEELNSAGSGLTYDSSTGQFRFNWKTDKNWSSSCRLLEVVLDDGSSHYALMQFH